jgi:glycosyltransferase involved in cell wall biosynthesis
MRVAVIIAARDLAHYIGDAIGSVLGQSHTDLRLIVVDDGSADATVAVVAGFADTRLQLVRETGRGVSAARNRGAAEAGPADAFLFLDGDDWLAPGALTLLVAALTADGDAAASHAPFAYVAEAATPASPGRLDRRAASRRRDIIPALMLGNIFANGGHVLIRAAAWEAAGAFREDLIFAEDWEFWPRLALLGPFVAVGRDPLLYVRRRAGSLMHGGATRMEAYRPALAAIAGNAAIAARLGERRFRRLLRRAETELSWTIGREMLRRGDAAGAAPLLWRGLLGRPRPQRMIVLAAASLRAITQKRGA